MSKKTMYLTPQQHTALRALKDGGRGDVTGLVREGVDLVLAFYAGAADMGGQALIDHRETVLARLRGGAREVQSPTQELQTALESGEDLRARLAEAQETLTRLRGGQ